MTNANSLDLYLEEPGQAFYFYIQFDDQTKVPHYFISVCTNDEDHGDLLFVCCTSNVKSKRQRIASGKCPPETIVVIPIGSYIELPLLTAIDCNSIIALTRDDLRIKFEEQGSKIGFKLSTEQLLSVRDGIHSSIVVERKIKRRILAKD